MQFLRVAVAMIIFFLATTPCSLSVKSCQRNGELVEVRRVQAIKQDILWRLGLDEEPTNPLNASDIPTKFLKEFKAVQVAQELNHENKPCAILDFNVKEVKPISPAEVKKLKPNLRAAVGGVNCIRNNLSEFYSTYRIKFQVNLSNDEFISSAQLRLRKFPLQLTNNMQESVQRAPQDDIDIRLITELKNSNNDSLHIHITVERLVSNGIGELAIFDVTKAVVLWLESSPSQSNIGELELDVQHRCPYSLTQSNIFIPNFQFFENSVKDGLLVLTTHKKKNGNENNRNKRQEVNNDPVFCNGSQVECCMKRFTINFERDLNWTWVSRPKEITLNYCQGECPIKWGLSNSNQHTQFLDVLRYRNQHNPTPTPEPCCVPNSFSDINLLINVAGTYSMQNLNNVVATSCSCR